MDRTKRLLLLVAASCVIGHQNRMAFAQAEREPSALEARVMVKMTKVKEEKALSASDLLRMPEFAGQDIAQIQAALEYWGHTGKLVPIADGKYYDQTTDHG